MYYCIWRTQTENDKLDKQRKPRIHQYRLPLEEEWAYVATQPKSLIVNTKSVEDLPGPSKCNKPNIWGLYNLEGNVSEWTASYIKHGNLSDTEKENKQYVVRGGSWRNNNGADARIIADQSEKAANIGFRIVRTCLSGR
ncbi:MAG: SUMF1/EgtB/PvdO family nonheme iron enzyme [Bacteroidales bacterium]|nr:SUMF1/EgtB/PvdO family nonheme iron enzyme [Bacteroidales bacterium]